MEISRNVSQSDRRQGIVGITVDVVECPCGRQTNLVFVANGQERIACTQECADKSK